MIQPFPSTRRRVEPDVCGFVVTDERPGERAGVKTRPLTLPPVVVPKFTAYYTVGWEWSGISPVEPYYTVGWEV